MNEGTTKNEMKNEELISKSKESIDNQKMTKSKE